MNFHRKFAYRTSYTHTPCVSGNIKEKRVLYVIAKGINGNNGTSFISQPLKGRSFLLSHKLVANKMTSYDKCDIKVLEMRWRDADYE